MKRILMVVIASMLVSLLPAPLAVQAQSAVNPGPETYAGEALCLPGVYMQETDECLPLGPSAFLTEMARKGMSFPQRPLPAYHPGPELDQVDVNYARLSMANEEPAPVYGSLEAAVSGESPSRYISPGLLRYVSFTQRQDIDSAHYVLLKSGEWMRASPAALSSTFQGLVFKEQPRTSFGWIVENAEVRSAPDYNAPVLNVSYPREAVIQIFDKVDAAGTEWYMVGMDQWIEHRYARQFVLNTTPPEGVSGDRWIDINLYQQTLGVYEKGKLVFATLIASGVDPFWTRPGTFKIYQKKPLETMSGAFESDKSDYYYLEDVPWTMYFDEARALHGAYWRAMFGYPQSHGCINLSIGDSRWLFDWAKEGDWVHVYDPSGQTPTDPKYYGKGGA